MGNKSNAKSVRLSDEILEYIENYRGNGFNEKFENIILDAKCSEQERLERIERLDKRIIEKNEELTQLINNYNSLDDLVRQAFRIDDYIKRVNETIAKLRDDSG